MLPMSVILLIICWRGWSYPFRLCSEVLHYIRNQSFLEECEYQLRNLINSIKCVRGISEHFFILILSGSYQASISPRAGLGRPKFLILKDQLEYLISPH